MDKRILVGVVAILIIVGVVLLPKGKAGQPRAIVTAEEEKEDTTGLELYEEASKLKKKGDIVKAQAAYQEILTDHSDFGEIERVKKNLKM